MNDYYLANRGVSGARFVTTQWELLDVLALAAGATEAERSAALGLLLVQYERPACGYIQRKFGVPWDQAEDMTQGFFAWAIKTDWFKKAERSRGRFRDFVKKCLHNYVINTLREAEAEKRHPKAGQISLDQSAEDHRAAIEPIEHETPDALFDRLYVEDTIRAVLDAFAAKCGSSDSKLSMDHYRLFVRRVLKPTLEGTPKPSSKDLLEELSDESNIKTKAQVDNAVTSAVRAFRGLFEEGLSARGIPKEAIRSEVRALFRKAARP